MTRAGAQAGQALVEAAVTIAVLVAIGVAAVALTIRIVAQVELESAVANGAASTLTAPLGAGDRARAYAADAVTATLSGNPYLELVGGSLECAPSGAGDFFAGVERSGLAEITCHASARLHLERFPVPLGPTVTVSASATVVQPAFRQCGAVTAPTEAERC